ncbi:MAG: PAS domain-containing sensor histidine kinase [Alteromonadaceae bacterium]|nr:MAG: PAS domain-containing sensor histidine kinase [Alteromonadaceae bacterium]
MGKIKHKYYATIIAALAQLLIAHEAIGSPLSYFNDEDGNTKWQYVANFSSAVLILLLSVSVATLFFSHRHTRKANQALQGLSEKLEQRVADRTATLDESNSLLTRSNSLLIDEIADHKNTSEHLRDSKGYIKDILQSLPSMLIGLDGDLNVTQWNQCAEETTGVFCRDILGKNLWEAYPAISIDPEQVQQVLKSQKMQSVKHSQRGQYYFDITIYPLREQKRRGVVILVDNVTQRTVAENMLIQRDKMSSMGELASTMAHDIDVPLQALLGDLNATQDEQLSEAAQTRLKHAVERAKQTSHIIQNLLDFSRSQGRAKKPVAVTDILDRTLNLAKSTLSEPSGLRFIDISITKQYQQDLPQLPCYQAELQQVFLSLFRHACHALGKEYIKQPKPAITIEVSTSFDALWVKIHHNGRGLTGQEQQEIFEPFFHSNDSQSTMEAENRLSFSQFIVCEHHQGEIAVTSDQEADTTFHIQFQLG